MRQTTEHLGHRARAAAIAAAAAVLAAALLLLLGSGSASSAPTATASSTVTVKMKDFSFKPGTVSISKGDRVVWVNKDSVKHNATKGGSFTTGNIKPGGAVAVKFGSKGTYRYVCTLHPGMSGKIVVG